MTSSLHRTRGYGTSTAGIQGATRPCGTGLRPALDTTAPAPFKATTAEATEHESPKRSLYGFRGLPHDVRPRSNAFQSSEWRIFGGVYWPPQLPVTV
jgi:hypothetical protein